MLLPLQACLMPPLARVVPPVDHYLLPHLFSGVVGWVEESISRVLLMQPRYLPWASPAHNSATAQHACPHMICNFSSAIWRGRKYLTTSGDWISVWWSLWVIWVVRSRAVNIIPRYPPQGVRSQARPITGTMYNCLFWYDIWVIRRFKTNSPTTTEWFR